MNTYKDFAIWAGGQQKAADLIGINKYRSHRLYHGRDITPIEAAAIEKASGGVFRREAFLRWEYPANDSEVMG